MIAVIPVAGTGVRLRPLTYTQPKPLIPVAGKPIVSYIIENLQSAGIDKFVFIIGYLGEKIESFLRKTYPDLDMQFVEQVSRDGSGHAIWLARKIWKKESELVIIFGDTILDLNFQKVIDSKVSTLCVKEVNNPRDFGVVELDDNGNITRVVEKPLIPKSNLAMVGLYKICEVKELEKSLNFMIKNNFRSSDEFPLTDALQQMINKNIKFETMKVDNWYDCGKRDILLETNATMLDRNYDFDNVPHFDSAIFIHPVSIGKNCKINNSIIGPHATIGDNAVIDSAIIKNSIIGNYTAIKDAVLQSSVVGNDTSITGLTQSLNIGDNTEIDFSK